MVIFDSKGFIDWPEYKLYTNLQDVVAAKEPKLIYRPGFEELQNEDTVNRFFSFIYERQNTFIYVDETPSIATASSKPSNFLGLLQRGRERGISVLAGTQRPIDVPKVIFTESKHFYIFRTADDSDRRKISSNIGVEPGIFGLLREQEFLYFNFNDGLSGPYKVEDK